MICTNCGYDLLHVHRTGDQLITYCPQCGDERREKREPKRKRWTPERREIEKKKININHKGHHKMHEEPRKPLRAVK